MLSPLNRTTGYIIEKHPERIDSVKKKFFWKCIQETLLTQK